MSIVLAHAHIAECEFGGGEWRSSVFPVNAAFLPAHVQYVALGHMHKPQVIPGAKSQARYAGSILQMDFGEREQQKSVCLIDAHPGKPATVTTIDSDERQSACCGVAAQQRRFSRRRPNSPMRGSSSYSSRTNGPWNWSIKSALCRASSRCDLKNRRQEGERIGESANRRIGDRPAAELFSDYYKLKRKNDPDPQLIALFDRLYREESIGSEAGD